MFVRDAKCSFCFIKLVLPTLSSYGDVRHKSEAFCFARNALCGRKFGYAQAAVVQYSMPQKHRVPSLNQIRSAYPRRQSCSAMPSPIVRRHARYKNEDWLVIQILDHVAKTPTRVGGNCDVRVTKLNPTRSHKYPFASPLLKAWELFWTSTMEPLLFSCRQTLQKRCFSKYTGTSWGWIGWAS